MIFSALADALEWIILKGDQLNAEKNLSQERGGGQIASLRFEGGWMVILLSGMSLRGQLPYLPPPS